MVTGRLVAAASVSGLVLVLAGALLVAGGQVGWIRPDASAATLWAPLGLVGLYGATGLGVTLALLVSPDRTGFTAGHALVTVSWTVAALVLLARGISRPALRVAGLVLVAAAVAKVVLFDLVALDGVARVVAFLGAGLVLLTAGTRYTRLVAEAERDRAGRDGTGPASRPPRSRAFRHRGEDRSRSHTVGAVPAREPPRAGTLGRCLTATTTRYAPDGSS